MAYTIQINDYQRQLIAKVLDLGIRAMPAILVLQPPDNESLFKDALEEVKFIQRYLEVDIVAHEADCPNVCHGLCL